MPPGCGDMSELVVGEVGYAGEGLCAGQGGAAELAEFVKRVLMGVAAAAVGER